MTRYAEKTEVSTERSKTEIERILTRYGAGQFAYGTGPIRAMVGFALDRWYVRFILPLPDPKGEEFRRTPTGRIRTKDAAAKEYDQEIRRLWRALALTIKSKLETVQSGILTFEEEFMANIVLSDGQTISQHVLPRIDDYEMKKIPELLPLLE